MAFQTGRITLPDGDPLIWRGKCELKVGASAVSEGREKQTGESEKIILILVLLGCLVVLCVVRGEILKV